MEQVKSHLEALSLDETQRDADNLSDASSSYSLTESILDEFLPPDECCCIDLTALEILAKKVGCIRTFEYFDSDDESGVQAAAFQGLDRLLRNKPDDPSYPWPIDFKISSIEDLDLSSEYTNSGSGSDSSENEREFEQLTKTKYIQTIQFGKYEIDTWYYSPYPEEFGTLKALYICEYCLKYMKLEQTFGYHLGRCKISAPPGVEVYRRGDLSIWEVDPKYEKLYCQNLCLLSKLFLDHKTVFYDVDCFFFYVLCIVDKEGHHLVGYFSKDKDSSDGFNVACILTLPPYQKLGYGKLLISFSYELSKIEGVPGTPEKPLSTLGLISYRSYWAWTLLNVLKDLKGTTSIMKLSIKTGMTIADILTTLASLKMLQYRKDNIVCITPSAIEAYINSQQVTRPRITIDPTKIKWVPPSKRVQTNGNVKKNKRK